MRARFPLDLLATCQAQCSRCAILFVAASQGITDPLYLQHPPTYYLIEEDEEATRYSSLFRHRLITNRPDWMHHATPLQLAPAGSRRSLVRAAVRPQVQALPSPGEKPQATP